MTAMVKYARNPGFNHYTNHPNTLGNVRGVGDSLEYEDPMDKTWSEYQHRYPFSQEALLSELAEPAVRLVDIRARLIEEAPPTLYTYGKEHGVDPLDVTSFLAKDKDFGSEREHRAPVLFQIFFTPSGAKKPTGWIKDGGRIVLDCFNHAIRDFATILPSVLSSELAGHDIEYFFRQNAYIQLYDLIARQPCGYHEPDGYNGLIWHPGPPRLGTVGMKATRFRLQAGLPSWRKRLGTGARNQKMLDLIPAECKDPRVNSNRSFRDLTQAEQHEVAKVLKGTAPQRKRNSIKELEKQQAQMDNVAVAECQGDISDELEGVYCFEDSTLTLAEESSNTVMIHPINNNIDSFGNKTPPTSNDQFAMPVIKRPRGRAVKKARKLRSNKNPVETPLLKMVAQDQTPATGTKTSPINLDGASEVTNSSSSEKSNKRPRRYLAQHEADIIMGNDPLAARLMNARVMNGHPTSYSLTTEVKQLPDTSGRDFRTIVPACYPDSLDDNIAALQEALGVTRADFRERVGFDPPPSLIEEHKDESYAMQAHALQYQFSLAYRGPRPIPHLYTLDKWVGSYRNWKINDKRAQELWLASRQK
ncbi:hypothetical protein ACLMJK_002448 [Lecanora helva]